jgi:hypothetical protein
MAEQIEHQAATVAVIIKLAVFPASEAARISGVSPDLQRRWRCDAYLPPNGIRALHDVFQLAHMMALRAISTRTRNAPMARYVSEVCGNGIALHALLHVDAYEGDHLRVLSWDGEAFARVRRALRRTHAAIAAHAGDHIALATALKEQLHDGGFGWNEQAAWLVQEIFNERGIAEPPQRFFIWFADGRYAWENSIDRVFPAAPTSDPRIAGAVLVMDLAAMGAAIVERAGRAFAIVEVEEWT